MSLTFEVTDLPKLIEPLLFASLRIATAVMISPLFSGGLFPSMLRNTIVVSLSLAIYPHMAAHLPADTMEPVDLLALAGKEILVGGSIGLAIAALVQAFESVGAAIDVQTGLSNAVLYDPFGDHGEGPMAAFMIRLAVTFFVVCGGLQVLVALLFESFRIWPVASFHPTIDVRLADFATTEFSDLTHLVLRIATPVILVLTIVDIGFGLVNRVVPQLNVFFFTMPIKGVLSVLMIALFLSNASEIVGERVDGLRTLVDRLVPVFATPE